MSYDLPGYDRWKLAGPHDRDTEREHDEDLESEPDFDEPEPDDATYDGDDLGYGPYGAEVPDWYPGEE